MNLESFENKTKKPLLIFQNNPYTFPIIRSQLSLPTYLTTHITQALPIVVLSNPTEPCHINIPSQHWTITFTVTLSSSATNQIALSKSSTSQVLTPQSTLRLNTFKIPTCSPLSTQLQIFDGTDYRYRLENALNVSKARTIDELGSEPTNLEQYRIWNIRRMALVSCVLDGTASSWFFSLSETYPQDWLKFSTNFLKQYDSTTVKYKTEAAAEIVRLATHEPIPNLPC